MRTVGSPPVSARTCQCPHAARILAIYNTAGFVGSRSQGVADLLTLVLSDDPVTAAILAEPTSIRPEEFADFLIEQLKELDGSS